MICTCPVCVVTETNLKLRVKGIKSYFQSKKFGLMVTHTVMGLSPIYLAAQWFTNFW